MKTIRVFVTLVIIGLALPAFQVACNMAPSSRVVQVQTLKAVGHTAEAALATSAQLYASHQITAAQARQVMDFYDNRFQPVYRIAVNAAKANLDSIASPELADLAAQISALVASYAPSH